MTRRRRVLPRRLYTMTAQFDIWTTHVVGAFADTTRDLFARDSHPFLNREYPPKEKQENPLTPLTCLCRLVYSHRARYGLTVLPFSSGIGVQATQTLTRGNDDQEADHNTFHRCLFLKCRRHYPNRKLDPYGLFNLVEISSMFRLFHLRYLSLLRTHLKRLSSSSPCKIPRGR